MTTTVAYAPGPGRDAAITLNGSLFTDPRVSRAVLRIFAERTRIGYDKPLAIDHRLDIPMGSGLGTSGAGALSLVLALNAFFGSPLATEDAAMIAHVAEIECATGLGTVMGELFGGCEIRTIAGGPGVGCTRPFDASVDTVAAFAIWGPFPTSAMLADADVRKRINAAGRELSSLLESDPNRDTFMRLSREFLDRTGLASSCTAGILAELDRRGIPASMLMFGDGVFTLADRATAMRAMDAFESLGLSEKAFLAGLDRKGARIS
jgi:pantoate kinase